MLVPLAEVLDFRVFLRIVGEVESASAFNRSIELVNKLFHADIALEIIPVLIH